MRKVAACGLSIAVAMFAGCGGDDANKPSGKPAGTKPSGAAATKPGATATFSSKAISGEGFKVSHIEAVQHTMQAGDKQYTSIILQLANYDRGGGSWHPAPGQDGQCRITLNYSTPAGSEFKAGPYKVDGMMAEDYFVSIGIEGRAGGATANAGLMNGEGTAEITHYDGKTVSGKIDVKDSAGTTLKAEFTATCAKP